ncbi:MAG: exodeoxyribonuclease V subunit beta [Candidatus Competibacteraceae bacterium]|nr:exodeoxyribonuclease V subunit beta [Candidatus Competibacteraceae bacterium]MCP5125916.1 exodeoxyribonuclease V subunit beta [Gammaproteobacteria bacterium]HRX69821.1 exodeoxyribonuclease V subunit beta [Candidatus Competibacteraceae bacterium]
MQRLDPLYTPLSGFNLIEASAGTGKTYTITALYVRLVVEGHIPVNRILVVTYTNAATKELRDRIRGRLAQIRHAFLRGRADDEDELGMRLLDLAPDRELAIRRLSNALRGFDEAAIFTIHGFCKRVLGDNAFESGLSFDTELMADTRELLQEIVEDFWRRQFYPGSPLVVQYFLDRGDSPQTLLKQVEPHLGKPYLHIMTPNGDANGAALEQAFIAAFQKARDVWRQDRAAIEDLLLNSPALNRQKYNLKSIPGWLETMDAYLSADPPKLMLFNKFEQFTMSKLHVSLKKGQTAPHHIFFDACDALNTACEALADYCRYQIPVQLLEYCNRELALRKRRQQLQSYDDLLLDLHSALHDAHRGAALIETLRNRYAAALIDEFQDTDPVQYEIFRRIYVGTGKPVFLVGDPKQAIYSFRGADIFAYLTARSDTQQQHTLDVNWRSDPRLLTALNAVFGAVKDQPFLFEGIPFHPAIPAERKQHPPLRIQGQLEPPLHLWQVESDASGKPINKGVAGKQAAQATAAEIARLLNLGARHQAHIGERPLAGGDIAVLVRSHWQGRLIRRQLLQLNVPSVQHADDSVFLSDEARQLEWLLAAIAEPGHEGRVRTALASALFGLSGETLHQLHEEEQTWARWLEKFQDYRQLWQEHSFMRFFRVWLIHEGVPQRLLAFRDGERRLTNVLHLAELLHIASRAHPGMAGLLKWLGDSRRLPANKDEEQQLRLESDENLVRIVTVHKSKGLEYEIVFCPFLWDGRLRTGEEDRVLYHDPADLRRSVLAIGVEDDDPAIRLARREEMAESLRLFYVALTRAKQRCYLVWGKIKEADTAPPAWLLHHPAAVGPTQDALDVTRQRFDSLTPAAFLGDLQSAFAPAGDTVAITPLPEETGSRYQPPTVEEPVLRARTFTGSLAEFWRVGSFTSLTVGLSAEMPDYDMTTVAPMAEPEWLATPRLDLFSFPRGARAGTCLHAIFERLDFSQQDRERLEKLVERTLTGHGLEAEEWTPVVANWVERVLATPLDGSELRLEAVTLDRRLNELEFYYPLAHLRPEALRRVLERHGYAAGPFAEMIENLEFSPLRGYMKGFIDLVFEAEGRFYLVDYKSNWLGPEPAAYQPERLAEAMAREAYVLQYLIYTVALHRYLGLRVLDYDYERHFGGVFYLFLRGMDPARGAECGVFHDRPASALVTALDASMGRGG